MRLCWLQRGLSSSSCCVAMMPRLLSWQVVRCVRASVYTSRVCVGVVGAVESPQQGPYSVARKDSRMQSLCMLAVHNAASVL
jgi:hypothetical protein